MIIAYSYCIFERNGNFLERLFLNNHMFDVEFTELFVT